MENQRQWLFYLTLLSIIISTTLGLAVNNVKHQYRRITYNQSLPHQYPGSTIGVSFESMVGGQLAYVVCTKGINVRKCKLYLDNFKSRNNPFQQSCDVTFKTEHENSIINEIFTPIPLTNKNVIIWWYESNPRFGISWRFTTTNMPTCKSVVLPNKKVENLTPETFTLVDDGYVAIVKGDEDKCKREFCSAYFDGTGKLISEVVPWIPVRKNVAPRQLELAPALPPYSAYGFILAEGFFDIASKTQIGKISLFSPGSQPVELKKYESKHGRNYDLALSTANGFIGYCTGYNREATCSQNDLFGRRKFSDVRLDLNDELKNIAIHNLPNGGFLMLTSRCFNPVCADDKNEYYVMEYYPNGQSYADTVVPKPMCNTNENAEKTVFFENNEKDYCLMSLCYDDNDPEQSNFKVSVVCLDGMRGTFNL